MKAADRKPKSGLTAGWIIARIAVPLLAVFLILLLGTTYIAQKDLRGARSQELLLKLDKRASGLARFLADRRGDIDTLLNDHALEVFFSNRALGMSMEYGLRASLLLVQTRFEELVADGPDHPAPRFQRLTFVEPGGHRLIDAIAAGRLAKTWTVDRLPAVDQTQMRLVRHAGHSHTVIIAPFRFKGQHMGTVVAQVDLDGILSGLMRPDIAGQSQYMLISRGADWVIDTGPAESDVTDRPADDMVLFGDPSSTRAATYHRRTVPESPFLIAAREIRSFPRDFLTSPWYLFMLAVSAVLVSALVYKGFLASRRAERAMELAKVAAEEATRAKSAFLANTSHEIRTPMNAVIGLAHLALQTDLSTRQRGYLEKIHRSAKGLLRVLDDILDFSKIESGRLSMEETPFRLEDTLDDLVGIVGLKAGEKQLKFDIDIRHDVPTALVGDPFRLSQVLINLGNNAVKFTEPGGMVRFRVAVEEDDDASVFLHFTVEDSGIGISKEELARLFESFSQADSSTSRRYGGSGLGLVISKNLVEMMGGRLWVDSEKGRGSTFHFLVRLKKQHGTPSRRHDHDTDDRQQVDRAIAQLRGATVLVVEDHKINQELAYEILTGSGLRVEVARNGLEALQRLEERPFDGVLMDIQMPVMDGYTATRRIRAQTRFDDLPIIAMTANAMRSDRRQSLEAGMNDHIAKPIDVDRLLVTLAKWIHPARSRTNRPDAAPPQADVANTDLPTLPGIDTRAGLSVAQDDRELYLSLLRYAREEYRGFEHRFREAQNSDDPQAALRLAHTLKGSAASIGAFVVEQAAHALESSCRTDANRVDDALAELLSVLRPMIDGLETLDPVAAPPVGSRAGAH